LKTARVLISIVTLAGLAAGCHRAPPAPARPHVLLITIDTLRPDRLSCYGYRGRATPHLDRLAGEGVLFERAVTDVPWTTAAMTSVFTGRYAPFHGVRLPSDALAVPSTTLAGVLRDNGYATGAIIGSFPLASIYNLNQGFQTYDEEFDTPMIPLTPGQPPTDMLGRPRKVKKVAPLRSRDPVAMHDNFAEKVLNDAYRPDNAVTDRAIEWLTAHRQENFFLWVHYFGPHERIDFLQTREQQAPRVIADYDRDLAFTDVHVGRLLDAVDALGLRPHVFVILHADHGQSLGENEYVGHGDNLYQPTLRVPLLMRLPGRIPAGLRVAAAVQNVDIFPTILGVLGIPARLPLSGADLSPLWTRADNPALLGPGRALYSETFASTAEPHRVMTPEYGEMTAGLERHGLLRGNRMYIINALRPPCSRDGGQRVADAACVKLQIEELYNPVADPEGRDNLIDREAQTVAWFRQEVARQQTGAVTAARIELSPGQQEKLRVLGYGRD
jgi:arylsulfatase A-like enzyme